MTEATALEKVKARKKLNHAIENGLIIAQPCKKCGASKAQGHHEDYRPDLPGLLIGRALLLRAAAHLKGPDGYDRIKDLQCSADESLRDHIGRWKDAGKEEGFDNCEDEWSDLIDCPRCSAQYAAFKARKLMLGKAGCINGILTRMGNHLRGMS